MGTEENKYGVNEEISNKCVCRLQISTWKRNFSEIRNFCHHFTPKRIFKHINIIRNAEYLQLRQVNLKIHTSNFGNRELKVEIKKYVFFL